MAVRLIDASRFGEILEKWKKDCLEDNDTQGADIIYDVILQLDDMPTITPQSEWISTEDRLPESTECWETYIVTVNRSHWPTSSYDLCDAPYNEQLVASAQYDSKQKIWHLPWDEQLNALIQADDAPLNGDFVAYWMPLPESPKGELKNEN